MVSLQVPNNLPVPFPHLPQVANFFAHACHACLPVFPPTWDLQAPPHYWFSPPGVQKGSVCCSMPAMVPLPPSPLSPAYCLLALHHDLLLPLAWEDDRGGTSFTSISGTGLLLPFLCFCASVAVLLLLQHPPLLPFCLPALAVCCCCQPSHSHLLLILSLLNSIHLNSIPSLFGLFSKIFLTSYLLFLLPAFCLFGVVGNLLT